MIGIKVRSTFAVGFTERLRSILGSDGDMVVEVEPGTSVQELLVKMGSLGQADSFDDIMIHVFVNGKLKGFDYLLQQGDVLDIHIPVSGG